MVSDKFGVLADIDSLNVLLEGATYSSYKVYLDTDNSTTTGINIATWQINGFDYLIRNDSLFEAQSGNWIFGSKAKQKQSGINKEIAVKLSALKNLGNNLIIKMAALVRPTAGTELATPLLGGKTVDYIRVLPTSPPATFAVSSSTSLPT